MSKNIKLLDASLLEDFEKLDELGYWLKVMNRPNGWHYDLDHIWVLNELEKAGVGPGSTVVDAGAGQGIMQFLLASRGINVISVDFSPRVQPRRSRGIFQIIKTGSNQISYNHPYMDFMKYDSSYFKSLTINKLFKYGRRIPKRIYRDIKSYLYYLNEKYLSNHDNFGEITFLRAPFHEMGLSHGIADAVISISAIEHADIELFRKNVDSMIELLKPGAPLLLTTSATDEYENTFHEKSSGWCYSLNALSNFFPECNVQLNFEACSEGLIRSSAFIDRLDPYYYEDCDSFCFEKKIDKLPYLPLSIKITSNN